MASEIPEDEMINWIRPPSIPDDQPINWIRPPKPERPTKPPRPTRPPRPERPDRPNRPPRPPRPPKPEAPKNPPNNEVSATPPVPPPIIEGPTPESIKTATPDLIIFEDEGVPIEVMTDLLFENIGGQELINISRNDLINGQSLIYRPIKNLNTLSSKYNSQTLVPIADTSNSYFNNFAIKLENYIPSIGTGPVGAIVYIEEDTNNLIINVINLQDDERVEVQILSRGSVLNDTIYIDEES